MRIAGYRILWLDSTVNRVHYRAMIDTPPYLSTKQAAARLGISVLLMRHLAKTRKVPSYRMGHRTIVFNTKELDAYIAKVRRGPE